MSMNLYIYIISTKLVLFFCNIIYMYVSCVYVWVHIQGGYKHYKLRDAWYMCAWRVHVYMIYIIHIYVNVHMDCI